MKNKIKITCIYLPVLAYWMLLCSRIFFIKEDMSNPHCKKATKTNTANQNTNGTTFFKDTVIRVNKKDKPSFKTNSFHAHNDISDEKCPEIVFKGIIRNMGRDEMIATLYVKGKMFFTGISDTLENMIVTQIHDSGIALESEKNRCVYRLRK